MRRNYWENYYDMYEVALPRGRRDEVPPIHAEPTGEQDTVGKIAHASE